MMMEKKRGEGRMVVVLIRARMSTATPAVAIATIV